MRKKFQAQHNEKEQMQLRGKFIRLKCTSKKETLHRGGAVKQWNSGGWTEEEGGAQLHHHVSPIPSHFPEVEDLEAPGGQNDSDTSQDLCFSQHCNSSLSIVYKTTFDVKIDAHEKVYILTAELVSTAVVVAKL